MLRSQILIVSLGIEYLTGLMGGKFLVISMIKDSFISAEEIKHIIMNYM